MSIALYPGTFDPPTLGHFNLIQRMVTHFDRVLVAIGHNGAKTPTFPSEERIHLLKTLTRQMGSVEVHAFDGLLVDFAKSQGVTVIVRGLRSLLDLEYEQVQAQMNRQLGGMETLFLMVDEKYRCISSTLVREIGSLGKRLHAFVPQEIEEAVFHRLSSL